MITTSRETRSGLLILLSVFVVCLALTSFGQTNKQGVGDDKVLRDAIRRFESSPDAPLGDKFTYTSKNVGLNGDGRDEVIVWIPEEDMGGTSGYPILILSRTKNGYRRLMDIEQGWTPIIILRTRHGRWRDIAYQVAGGGVSPMYSIYRSNGKAYKHVRYQIKQPKGEVIIKKDWNQTTFGPIPKQ